MENKEQNNSDHFDEITFSELKGFFRSLADSIGLCFYRLVRYVLKNILYLVVLIALGFGLGYLLEYKSTPNAADITFNQEDSGQTKLYEVVVVPNYGSIDFLQDWVRLYKDEGDNSLFTNEILSVGVQGVENIYDLLEEKEAYRHALAILSSKTSEISNLLHDNATDKKYHYQKLSFLVSASLDFDAFFKAFQKRMEDEPYFQNRKSIEMSKLVLRKEELQRSVAQINAILDGEIATGESTDLANLVAEKDELLERLTEVALKIAEGEEVLYEVYRFETREAERLQSKVDGETKGFGKKLQYPILFVLLFVLVNWGVKTYKKQHALNKQS